MHSFIARTLASVFLIQVVSPHTLPQTAKKESSGTFSYYQALIFLRVRVNETGGLLFLLDTGANASAIDLKTADTLKLPFTGTGRVEGTAGVSDVKKVHLRSITIGKARAKNLRIPAYDLSGSLAPPGTRLDGILGYDFLRFFSIQLDFTSRVIAFANRTVRRDRGKPAAARIPFTLDKGIPRVHTALNDSVAADFRLDTGASLFETADVYLNVTEDVWKQLTLVDKTLVPERYFKGSGVGGEIKLPVARIRRLAIGPVSILSPFIIVQPRAGYFARPDAVGFISNNLLEKFSPVTIDYIAKKLYLFAQK